MKLRYSRFKSSASFSILVCLTAGFLSSPTLAAEPRIESNVTVAPKQKLAASEKASLSRAAGRILLHVDDARKAIGDNNKEDALSHIEKGSILVRIIEESSPDYEVKATIKAGGLTYEDVRKHRQLFVPVYEELDEVSAIGPVLLAKREQAKKTDSVFPVVQDVRLRYTRAELNIALAKLGLGQAKKALKNDQPEKANDVLSAIQTSVMLNYAEIDLPLEEARKNLLLAQGMVAHDELKEARVALEEASEALEEYEKNIGESRGEKVKAVRGEIQELASTIESKQENNNISGSLKEKIDGWWNSVTEWLS